MSNIADKWPQCRRHWNLGGYAKQPKAVAEKRQFLQQNMAIHAKNSTVGVLAEAVTMAHRISRAGSLIAGLLSVAAAAETPPTQATAAWRLVRSANPAGGSDAVSMTRSADLSSDRDLAGLMLQCHGTSPEIIVVVVTPFPPHAQPNVTIGANGQEWHFQAELVPPGAEVLLPTAATDLASGPWQSAHQLAVKISWQQRSIDGVIPIDGLRAALSTLAANCPTTAVPTDTVHPN
jgi:hypothetical protein